MKNTQEEIQERIQKVEKELTQISGQRAGASPEKLLKLDEKEAEDRSLLDSLKAALRIQQEAEKEPDEYDILMSGLRKYVSQKEEKVTKIEKQIEDQEEQLRKAEEGLLKATDDADLMGMSRFGKERDDLKRMIEYAQPGLTAARSSRTFPEGAVLQEWQKVCDDSREEWDQAVEDVKTMRESYLAAVGKLMRLHDLLMRVRRSMGEMSVNMDGVPVLFHQVLTVEQQEEKQRSSDVNPWLQDMKVSKTEGLTVQGAFSSFDSPAL